MTPPDPQPDPPPGGTTPATSTPPPRRLVVLAGVAALAAAAGAGMAWRRTGASPGSMATDIPADLAPLWALRVERPEGGELVLDSMRGKPLLINFWATWCAPCVREMPEINRFHKAYAARGWQVVGLAIDGPTPVREFLARVKVGFPIGLAGLDGTDLLRALGNAQGALPFSVLIGADGRVLRRKLGETRFDELAGWADKA